MYMVITVGQPKQWGVHSIDQRGEKMTQARNCNAEQQVAHVSSRSPIDHSDNMSHVLKRAHCSVFQKKLHQVSGDS